MNPQNAWLTWPVETARGSQAYDYPEDGPQVYLHPLLVLSQVLRRRGLPDRVIAVYALLLAAEQDRTEPLARRWLSIEHLSVALGIRKHTLWRDLAALEAFNLVEVHPEEPRARGLPPEPVLHYGGALNPDQRTAARQPIPLDHSLKRPAAALAARRQLLG